ncbi:MAG: hypothetical protein ACE5OR_09055 [bacterium]
MREVKDSLSLNSELPEFKKPVLLYGNREDSASVRLQSVAVFWDGFCDWWRLFG